MFMQCLCNVCVCVVNVSWAKARSWVVVGIGRHASFNLECPRGQLVAEVGPHSAGEATVLKLLTHSLLSYEGVLFITMHLWVLNVGRGPILLNRSLLNNLVYDNKGLDDISVVRSVISALNMEFYDTLASRGGDSSARNNGSYTLL